MVTGLDDNFWTTYGFFDTYYDGEASKHDARTHESTSRDPLIGGSGANSNKTYTARDYFLRALQSAVSDAQAEWLNSGFSLLKWLKALVSPSSPKSVPPILTIAQTNDENSSLPIKTSHKIARLSEEMQHGLTSIIRAWKRFQDTDLAYFDLNSATSSTQRTLLSAIDKDIRDLQDLRDSLHQQTALFQSRIASVGFPPSPTSVNKC